MLFRLMVKMTPLDGWNPHELYNGVQNQYSNSDLSCSWFVSFQVHIIDCIFSLICSPQINDHPSIVYSLFNILIVNKILVSINIVLKKCILRMKQ